jgi:hypothetical protein
VRPDRRSRSAGVLEQGGAPRIELACGPAPELVDQQHLEVGLQDLVVVISEPGVGTGREELLPLKLRKHRCTA